MTTENNPPADSSLEQPNSQPAPVGTSLTRSKILVFGATGYTGRQVVSELQRRGLSFTIAGRERAKLDRLKSVLELGDEVSVSVADPAQPDSLPAMFGSEVGAIINCVGPFTTLGEPVVKAALEAGVHYLDITGEQAYLARMLTRYDNLARQKKVALIPACGFEYAMTNWAGALAVEGLEPNVNLWTATVTGNIKASQGTQLSLFEALARPGLGWRDGTRKLKLTASTARQVDFPPPFGRRRAVWAPFGEMITLPRHLSIRNLDSFVVVPTALGYSLQVLSPVLPPVSQLMGRLLKGGLRGPASDHLENSTWAVVAQAQSAAGQRRVVLQGQNVYYLTSVLTVWCAAKMLEAGFQASGGLGPAQAFDPTEALEYLKGFGLSYTVSHPA